MRVFVTHNAEDLDAYYARALDELRAIATVTTNPRDRDLTTDELTEHIRTRLHNDLARPPAA